MTTNLDLDAIEKRANAATDGPWEWTEFRDGTQAEGTEELGVAVTATKSEKPDGTFHVTYVCRGMTGPNRENNALFVANARTDIIALLTEVAVLTQYMRAQCSVAHLVEKDLRAEAEALRAALLSIRVLTETDSPSAAIAAMPTIRFTIDRALSNVHPIAAKGAVK